MRKAQAQLGEKRIGAPAGPRAANVAETKDRILRAAIGQFAQHGFSGARIEAICADANVNGRMVYHYYVDKAGLYLAVLEHVLGELRIEELKLDVSTSEPMAGLLTMFEFTFGHFSKHPELIRLLSAENLSEARTLRTSQQTPIVASPVIAQISELLRRGEADGTIRQGIDPVHLYVVMVALSYFHKSNAYTLAIIFGSHLLSEPWLADHRDVAREVLLSFLRAPASK
jgi:AcrR family transcriptional regulator